MFYRAKIFFKIGKKETDLKAEELINNPNRSNHTINQPKDVEMNPINNIRNNDNNIQDINIKFNNNNQIINKEIDENSINYPYPKLVNKKGFEENLD